MRRSVWLVLGLCACSGPPSAPAKARPPPLVTTTRVTGEDVSVVVRAPVDIRAVEQADLGSKTVGYLDAVLVDRGDLVKKGQTVALVRPSDLPDQLAAAKNAVAQAEAARTMAKANLERSQQLAPKGLVSQQELQNATTATAAAEAQLGGAQAQLAALGVRLGETRLEAPYDGVVTARRLDPGALMGPTTGAVLSIAKIDVVRAFVGATERQAPRLAIGQGAKVFVEGREAPYLGHVQRLAPSFDALTRTLDAEVHLDNSKRELRPGMYGRAEIELDVHRGAPVISVEAIQLARGKAAVFVVDGDSVHRREVALGEDLGDRVEVTKGLQPGEEIVVRGIDVLAEGAKIRRAGAQAADAGASPTAASR